MAGYEFREILYLNLILNKVQALIYINSYLEAKNLLQKIINSNHYFDRATSEKLSKKGDLLLLLAQIEAK